MLWIYLALYEFAGDLSLLFRSQGIELASSTYSAAISQFMKLCTGLSNDEDSSMSCFTSTFHACNVKTSSEYLFNEKSLSGTVCQCPKSMMESKSMGNNKKGYNTCNPICDTIFLSIGQISQEFEIKMCCYRSVLTNDQWNWSRNVEWIWLCLLKQHLNVVLKHFTKWIPHSTPPVLAWRLVRWPTCQYGRCTECGDVTKGFSFLAESWTNTCVWRMVTLPFERRAHRERSNRESREPVILSADRQRQSNDGLPSQDSAYHQQSFEPSFLALLP